MLAGGSPSVSKELKMLNLIKVIPTQLQEWNFLTFSEYVGKFPLTVLDRPTISLCSALPCGRFRSSLTPSWPVLGGNLVISSLEDKILRHQYFLTCHKSLQTFLKEKGKLSLKEMTKASNDYYEAHGFPNGNQDKRSNGNGNKPYTHGKLNDGQPHGPPNVPLRSWYCLHMSSVANPKALFLVSHKPSSHVFVLLTLFSVMSHVSRYDLAISSVDF